MDADDLCPPDRLEKQVAAMECAAGCGGVLLGPWEMRDASDATVQRFDAIEDASLVPWLLLL